MSEIIRKTLGKITKKLLLLNSLCKASDRGFENFYK